MQISARVLSELAPRGLLRAGINLSNFLLVTGRDASGNPIGVAPDMAQAMAEQLGVPVQYVPFATPGELGDRVGQDVWDVGLIGAEPQRAQKILFSAAYVEIAATYLVGPDSKLQSVDEVDHPGVRIASTARAAYDLWLERNIRNAEVVRSTTLDGAYDDFVSMKLDALAGLRPRLLADAQRLPGARILDGQFSSVQQAIGTARANEEGARFIREFVEAAKQSGLVARLIEKHGVSGLTVAPPAA
jgi:polar amino acid transport system substrate-binding protein